MDNSLPGPTPAAPMTRQRRERIAELVTREGVKRVTELSKLFGVSEVTIRSDLAELERAGVLTRDRGGATVNPTPRHVFSLARVDERSAIHLESKRRIAQAAAGLVVPGDSVILDAGTTVVEMARHLPPHAPLTVVTNALNVAMELGAVPGVELILLGGAFHRVSASTLGPLAEQALAGFCVEKLFLGTQALDLTHGLTDSTSEIASVKRAMIRAALEIILVTDSSKLGQTALHKVAPLSEINVIITDVGFPEEDRTRLEASGIRMILV